MVQPNNLSLSFSSESSIEDELKRESNADVITILVSYIRGNVLLFVLIVGDVVIICLPVLVLIMYSRKLRS